MFDRPSADVDDKLRANVALNKKAVCFPLTPNRKRERYKFSTALRIPLIPERSKRSFEVESGRTEALLSSVCKASGVRFSLAGPPGEGLEETLEAQQREALVKLFALAVKTDHESRAVEICKLMTDTDTIEIAIKYASKMRKIQLAERLGALANKLVEAQEEDKENEEEDAMDAQSCRYVLMKKCKRQWI